MSVVSLLAAVVIHGGVVAGGWAIAGTTGVIAALTIVVAVEHRLARNRALTAHNTDRRTALLVDSFTASQQRHHPSISLLVPLRGDAPGRHDSVGGARMPSAASSRSSAPTSTRSLIADVRRIGDEFGVRPIRLVCAGALP